MKLRSKQFEPVVDLLHDVGAKVASWQGDLSHRTLHSKENFKTEADRRAHDLMTTGLANLFPGVSVISEEDLSHSEKRPTEYWLIDPIDGTASWYHGFD